MRVPPQVSDRIKEAPAQALRGVFAGIGQVLLITDKLRNKMPYNQHVSPSRAPELSQTRAEPVATVPAASITETEPGAPLPNYDELSIASLRARLRNLDVAQVRQLAEYEKAHAARAEVMTMFERRIAKLEAEMNTEADERGEAQAEAEVEAREEEETEVQDDVEAEAEGET
jgi:hypothetical protein